MREKDFVVLFKYYLARNVCLCHLRREGCICDMNLWHFSNHIKLPFLLLFESLAC